MKGGTADGRTVCISKGVAGCSLGSSVRPGFYSVFFPLSLFLFFSW